MWLLSEERYAVQEQVRGLTEFIASQTRLKQRITPCCRLRPISLHPNRILCDFGNSENVRRNGGVGKITSTGKLPGWCARY